MTHRKFYEKLPCLAALFEQAAAKFLPAPLFAIYAELQTQLFEIAVRNTADRCAIERSHLDIDAQRRRDNVNDAHAHLHGIATISQLVAHSRISECKIRQ